MDKHNNLVRLYKPIGKTPLEIVQEYKKQHPELEDQKMAYAGRLDPMAHGKLLVLIGDECKKRDFYQSLDKEYRFRVLFGLSTDTYDMLGLVGKYKTDVLKNVKRERIEEALNSFRGNYEQEYPPYSSKTVDGKPLFWWAREGRLDEIEIPRKKVNVSELVLKDLSKISGEELHEYISGNIRKMKGDFRQEEVLRRWDEVLLDHKEREFPVAEFHARVSSGTYVRSIAQGLGQRLDTGAFALEIERTNIAGL